MNKSEENAAYVALLKDKRFKFETYLFVNEVLERATSQGVGELKETELDDSDEPDVDVHITGRQLCRIAVEHAVEQYGAMARVTLERLGLYTTGDIGDAVFNMIEVGLMAKTADDAREDFDAVFDLGDELDAAFQFAYEGRKRD